jgi:hypothetical protein
MLIALKTLFLGVLGCLVYQDFKERKVTAYLFLILAVSGGYIHYTTQYLEVYVLNLLFNFSGLLLLLFVLIIYTKFILKKKLNDAIGLGDILFFFVLGISFPTATFLVILSSSLIFSLSIFLVLKPRLKEKTVPLAGLQALFLIVLIGSNMLFNFINLYAV